MIPNTTDVLVDISRQSLRVASLIHEYSKLPLTSDSLIFPINFKSNDSFSQSQLSKYKAAI